MESTMLSWAAFIAYAAITSFLAIKGMRLTKNFSSFAIGSQDMGPYLVGITLAASIASTATFVINPGFVYTHGLSAFLHFAIASPLGFLSALFFLSKGFRRFGQKSSALTLPQWIHERYKSSFLRGYFAILNLVLSITFIVLIVKGSALIMGLTLGLNYVLSLTVIVGFVFSYVILGGTYAHAFTNTLQGLIMIAVALIIFASGLEHFTGGFTGFLSKLASIDTNLTKPFNPASSLYSNVWEVFVCAFLISMGLVCQPHIIMKSMYLRSDRDLNKYLAVTSVVSVIFALLLITGFYARLSLPSVAGQDAVMATYIASNFSTLTGVFISVALLAAGMSTLDGILVGASTIAANDLFLGLFASKRLQHLPRYAQEKLALKASRYLLVLMGIVSFIIALNPPKLVGLFAQMGIYGLTAAVIVPTFAGIFVPRANAFSVTLPAIVGPLIHFVLYSYQTYYLGKTVNPAVTASMGIAVSVLIFCSQIMISRRFQFDWPLKISNKPAS